MSAWRCLVVALVLMAAPASAQTILTGTTTSVSVGPRGGPDGVAAGDMDGDGRPEIAYVLRHGRYNTSQGNATDSSLAVFRATGTGPTLSLLFQINTTQTFVGFPTFADFDGDGRDEVAICELSKTAGSCRAYKADGSELTSMRVDNLAYAAMTNGGPTAADLNEDGYPDLIIPTYGGEIIVKPGKAATGFTYDTWTRHSDWVFGHVAVGDVLGDGHRQIVVGGAATGSFHVISRTGTHIVSSPAQYNSTTNEGYFYYGSGPTLADLDGNGDLEVISVLDYYSASGTVAAPKLMVHNVTTSAVTLLASTNLPASASFTSAVVGDIQGDRTPEIVLMDNTGRLHIYRYASNALTLLRTYQADSSSWSTPALVDTDLDGDLEIIVTGGSGAYVLRADSNTNITTTHTWSSASSFIFPQPIVVDANGDGTMELYTGTWATPRLVALKLPFSRANEWNALGSDAAHQGSVATSGGDLISDNPAVETFVVLKGLTAKASSLPSGCTSTQNQTRINNAVRYANYAHREYLRGNPHLSIDYLRQAESALASMSTACNVAYWRERTAYSASLEFRQYIDRTAAALGSNHSAVTTANNAYNNAQTSLRSAQWSTACTRLDNGAAALRNLLDTQGSFTVSTTSCTSGNPEIFLAWECDLINLYSQIGGENLRSVIVWLPDLVIDTMLGYADNAASDMASRSTAIKVRFATDIQRIVRLYIDHAQLWFANVDASALTTAENAYSAGVNAIANGNYVGAMTSFQTAVAAAKPCPNTNQGLMGGGC